MLVVERGGNVKSTPNIPRSPLPAVTEFITSSGQATVVLATNATKFVSHHVEAFRHTLGTAFLTMLAAVAGSAVVVPGALLSRSVGDDVHRKWIAENRTESIAFDFHGWDHIMSWHNPSFLGFLVWYAAVSEVYVAYHCFSLYSMYGWRRVGWSLGAVALCAIFLQGFLVVLPNILFINGQETLGTYVVLGSFCVGTGGILSQFYITQRVVPERNLTRVGIISTFAMSAALYFYYNLVFNLYYSQSLAVAVVMRVVVHTAVKNILLGITVNLFTRLKLANERALHLIPGGVVIFMAMAGRFMQILSTNVLLVVVTEILQVFVEVGETYTMMNMGRNPVNQTLKRATTHMWSQVKPQGMSFKFVNSLLLNEDPEETELAAVLHNSDARGSRSTRPLQPPDHQRQTLPDEPPRSFMNDHTDEDHLQHCDNEAPTQNNVDDDDDGYVQQNDDEDSPQKSAVDQPQQNADDQPQQNADDQPQQNADDQPLQTPNHQPFTRVVDVPSSLTVSLDLPADSTIFQKLQGHDSLPPESLHSKNNHSPKSQVSPKLTVPQSPQPGNPKMQRMDTSSIATQTLATRSLGAMNNGLTFARHVPPRIERLKTLYANLITCTAIAEGSASLIAMTFVLLANVNPGSSDGNAINRDTVLTNVAIVFVCEAFLSDFLVAYVNARLCEKKGFTDLAHTFKHRRRELDLVFIFGCAFLGGSVASFFVLSLCVVENKSGAGTVFNRCT